MQKQHKTQPDIILLITRLFAQKINTGNTDLSWNYFIFLLWKDRNEHSYVANMDFQDKQ